MDQHSSEPPNNEEDYSDISIRSFDISDTDDYMVWATDERVPKYCSWEPLTTKEETLNYINTKVLTHPWCKAICLKNRPIGYILVTKSAENRAELGYVLAFKYWGKGIGTRAVKLVSKMIFGEYPELERLEALVDVEHVGSQRVLEKAGFTRECVLRKHYILKGRCRDFVMFSFLSTDLLD
ncbi:Acyl-CoA N-acyltransferases (NAT) superfamily protein [Euphorbia peplus]|nr:Acyl-CoA N-acyltransferases (NAT) superfamily protein [Euphorbia peplus]